MGRPGRVHTREREYTGRESKRGEWEGPVPWALDMVGPPA